MPPTGGSAALNGFLYQIIQHLGWLSSVRLTGKLRGDDISNARLVLEPTNGGDAHAEAPTAYIVEQYKTRETRTWPLRDITSVLKDLRRAVPSSLPPNARYRFVTNGRAGLLGEFEAFLCAVKLAEGPDHLDDANRIRFSSSCIATHREFFDAIHSATHSTTGSAAHDRDVTLHLLSCFEMVFDIDARAYALKIDERLRPYVNNFGDEAAAREQLVGVLLNQLSQGEVVLNADAIDALFTHVGLSPARMRMLAKLPETMRKITRRRLGGLGYQADRDVRQAPQWSGEKPTLIISGESGVGKTWQLGRLLRGRGEQGDIIAFVQAARTCEELLSQAARDIWQQGLRETSHKTLVAVSHFLRELDPHLCAPGPIIALDDVQDTDLARALVRQDWADLGMRLVLVVPSAVGRALVMTDGPTIQVNDVGDFSGDELASLLRLAGRRWSDLPADLRGLLRRPILAGLFLELPYESIRNAPSSEYEILDQFWTRIDSKGKPGDKGIVTALAVHLADGGTYPLERTMWPEIGLSDADALMRIEATGWIRATEAGDVAFAHDRLLNWAVAVSFVNRFARGDLSVADLGAFEGPQQDRRPHVRMDSVPMDVLWLLAARRESCQTLCQLVRRWEDRYESRNHVEALYVHLLPTLGRHAVPILLERLNDITAQSDGDGRVRLIARAFEALAQQENVPLQEAIGTLLRTSSPERQNVGLAAVTAAPDADHLDRLWDLHVQRVDALVEDRSASRYANYQASFRALSTGIELVPAWLRDRILEAHPQRDRISELAYLLNAMEHPDASVIWDEAADTLMANVPTDTPRSLLYCIERFQDRDKLDFVIQHLSYSTDFANGAALVALSSLDAQMALDRLAEAGDAERYMFRNQWLPLLLGAQPGQTRRRILALAEAEPKERRLRFIVDLFWERPDQVDAAMLRFLLRILATDLRNYLYGSPTKSQTWLYHPLDFLGRVTRRDLLSVFEAEAGGELEAMIATVACSRLDTTSNVLDTIREHARRVLILIGGEGITTLISQELDSPHFWVRSCGLTWASLSQGHATVERLTALASRPVPDDADGNLAKHYGQELYRSTKALAALGADAELVDILETSGFVKVPHDLAQLRAHRGPMPKALSVNALQVLGSTDASEDSLLSAVTIAWLSGDVDLIPSVRAVLGRVNREGRVAGHACIALRSLGDTSDEFLRLARDLLETTANARWGLQSLVSMGGPGFTLLASWLQSHPSPRRDGLDAEVIRVLYDNPKTRNLSVEVAAARCQGEHSLFDKVCDIAAEAGDAALRERILDEAFSAYSFLTAQPLVAIGALAKFDVSRAVEAIELAFHVHPGVEQELCHLLIRIAPETAAQLLVESVLSVERESFRAAVGRALRRLDSGVVSSLIMARMSGSKTERRVAAELAGWVPAAALSDGLRKIAEQDSAIEARRAALSALDRHRQEANVRTLLSDFSAAPRERRWSLMVAILETGDPHLLTDPEDSLWLGNILSGDVPTAFKDHANWVLRQRKRRDN